MSSVIPAVSCCTVCGSSNLSPRISFGKQPPSNRFLLNASGAEGEESYPLSLGFCAVCGTIQLVDRMPQEAMRPRYDWLVYNEPEGHLDDVANRLATLPGVHKSSRFLGVTYKDQSTLSRMEQKGFSTVQCINEQHLETAIAPIGLETIQAKLTQASTINQLKDRYGQAEVLLVRHIVEHATSATQLVRSLSALVAPNGYMMIELPDSERIFSALNYPFVWEEHISYLTATSATRLAREANAEVAWLGRYPYAYEDSLVLVLRFPEQTIATADVDSAPDAAIVDKQLSNFASQFETVRAQWRAKLEGLRAQGETIAVFGAGHLAAKFINFFGFGDLIECVIDDHPKKAGMKMPGSGLPIIPSARLQELGIRWCVSTLSPESEIKVRAKLTGFFDNGGTFISAFNVGG